jgi:hypothetical protein
MIKRGRVKKASAVEDRAPSIYASITILKVESKTIHVLPAAA